MCPSIGLPRGTDEIPKTGPLGPYPYVPEPDTGYQYLVAKLSTSGQYLQLTGLTVATGRPYYLEGKTE